MDTRMLDMLACPICKGKLIYNESLQELLCRFDKLAYPIQNDVPIMLPDEARSLNEKEV